ncbi:FAS1-like dehydratase domain-containing protein [Denitrobaculum tricleocarpae]|uniref:Acyl-CoA dehydrogenase n=1 Tax=Denitrobaculum tricleocarpae TaxID=2591009 RepID=A0A545TWQ0_9PROT|nr:MaoC family dehydratase N-terminal domain-containing protein [Denitrobaculum tricleocarpae]TQV81648.1 acyl-CoA dehydrogenase [Denitrobaculum tricleocarpae]
MTSENELPSDGDTGLDGWIGRSQTQDDVIDGARARRLQATLDDPFPPLEPGDALPPLWHWAYFWEQTRNSELGPDGLAIGAGMLPPVDLPRIMWAGSRISFPAELRIGAEATRRSTILKISEKQGRSGRLCFVTLRHEVFQKDQLCVDEEMDVVYREAAKRDDALPEGGTAPQEADWSRKLTPDPVLLFRYSALTWNSHRIHYDRDYVMGQEGYPGLVVHGPLLATLMLDQVRRLMPAARVTDFTFAARRPVFDTSAFTVAGAREGSAAAVWVADSAGMLAMEGSAGFEV